ncbi:MAG: glutathione peroxidase [Armatimonadetes bacterium]|nr:glutathione peroxidase [Armatimonadota bacterium]
MPALLDLTVNDIDGKPVDLSKFEGKVIMIVNVASFCGLTKQYASLQKLYEQYKNKGFTILAFPANEFGQQEPGTNEEIKTFCHTHYKITFPIFSKIVVKGCGQHTLYKYLTSKTTNPRFGGEIEWNFAKFLINRKGEIVARFPANDDPLKPEVVEAIKDEIVRCR